MTFNFTVKEFILGNGTPTLQFYRRGFNLVGGGESPSWRDVVLSGLTALTLVNSKEDGLNYLKLFGGTELLPETYIDSVTLSGGCEQRNLPSEFTQVEYIQSTGTAWLDTGFIANGGMIFDGKVMPVDMDNLTVGSLTDTGTPEQANLTRNLISYANGNGYIPQKLDNYQTIYADAGTSPAIIHLDTTGTKFYCTINGNVVVDTTTNVLTNQTTTVKIGFSDYSQLIRKGRYYPLQFRNSNGDLVRDLVPAKNSSNVVSMYDKVTDTFLPVQGTGTFTAGADVTTPSPDYPMDIVCNNGVIKVNLNLYSTEYHDSTLSRVDGVTVTINAGTIGVNVSSMIDCRTIKSFMVTAENTTGSYRLYKYNSSKSFINADTTSNIGDVLTLDSTVGYFRIQYNYASINTQNILIYNSAHNLGIYTDGTQEVVTDGSGNTANAEMLLAVGDYKDTQEVISGSVTRNIGIKVLDGTEEWSISSSSFYLDYNFNCAPIANNQYCTHYSYETSQTTQNLQDGEFYIWSNGNRIRFRDDRFSTVQQFTAWLASQYANGTPVIVVYPTSSATTETVSGQLLFKSPVTQTAGSISNLPIAITESGHTVPTPQQPLQINCNNGVVKVSRNLFDYRYFYDNYMVPPTSTVGRVAIKLLPNTNYTVSTNTQQSSTAAQVWTDTGSNPNAFSPVTSTNGVLIDTPRTVQSDSNGYIILAIRVGTEYEIKESDFESGNVWVQIEQGSTVTPYTPYSPNGIYTDGTTETVEVTGKNLFDGQWQVGIYSPSTGGFSPTSNRVCNTNMIQVKPLTNYTVSCPNYELAVGMRWVFYDANKNFISAITNGATTVNTPSNAKYINFYIANNLTVETAPDLQLEQGLTATTYEPYFNGGTATAEMLLKIGTYQDEQEVLTGSVTRNVGVKVLDGTETWNIATSVHSGVSRNNFYMMFDDATATGTDAITCSIASWAQTVATDYSAPVCRISDKKNFNIVPFEDTTTIPNVASWKQYLAQQYANGTPVIIVYPLAEPTTETVTGQALTTQAGTNVVEITQGSIDNLGLEVSYKATT